MTIGHHRRKPFSEETKQKMSDTKIRKPVRYWLGKKRSPETIEKIRLANIGKKYTEEQIEKMKGRIPWNKGKTGVYSKETLEKMGKWQRGKKQSKETIEKRREKLIGRKHPPSWFEKHTGENNSTWRGDNCGYSGVHKWVIRWKGSPSMCEYCGIKGGSSRKYHWANVDHKYRRVLDDYIRMCCSCHSKYDRDNLGKKFSGK